MGYKPSYLPLNLALLALLAGCASQRVVPVSAPCPEIPPLPAELAKPAEFPAALARLSAYLTTLGRPPPETQPD